MRAMNTDIGMLHFTGIGGIGMSGIAEILLSLGYNVQGSDMAENANVKRLRARGVLVHIGHDADFIKDCCAVVVSSAVKDDNPEVVAARAAGMPVIRRAEMLAELMRLKTAIAVGGTHGKTTTTAMIGQMLEFSDFDPTVINGGIVNAYGTNTRLGASDVMVVEADESDGTFTRLPACVSVVTNIDAEHMDHYDSFDDVKDAYLRFMSNIPFYGYAVLCVDHPEVQSLIPKIKDRRVVTYGFSPQADVRADRIQTTALGVHFDIEFAGHLSESGKIERIERAFMPMLGEHNVQNALVALVIAHQMGVSLDVMRAGLAEFRGVRRRFTQVGRVDGVTIIDDYAHHPVEIETVLKTARSVTQETGGRVLVVMQPHRYSRLHDLFEGFSQSFHQADSVMIAPVYAAGEAPIEGVDHYALAAAIADRGHKDVCAVDGAESLPELLKGKIQQGDYVICMGAGDITVWAHELPEALKEFHAEAQGQAA